MPLQILGLETNQHTWIYIDQYDQIYWPYCPTAGSKTQVVVEWIILFLAGILSPIVGEQSLRSSLMHMIKPLRRVGHPVRARSTRRDSFNNRCALPGVDSIPTPVRWTNTREAPEPLCHALWYVELGYLCDSSKLVYNSPHKVQSEQVELTAVRMTANIMGKRMVGRQNGGEGDVQDAHGGWMSPGRYVNLCCGEKYGSFCFSLSWRSKRGWDILPAVMVQVPGPDGGR